MDELSDLARSRIERKAIASARKLSGRMGAVAVVFFSIVPFAMLAIAGSRGEIDSFTVSMAAVFLLFANFVHVYRVFFRLLRRQADELATLRKARGTTR